MGKWVVITGGTKGIGRALVDIFYNQGYSVITCSRSQSSVDETLQYYSMQAKSNQVYAITADLSLTADCQRFVAFVQSTSNQQVDILINNVGVFVQGKISEEPLDTLEKMWSTNVASAYHITKGLIDIMKEKKEGHIFFMCSTASIMPYINGGAYCITKYALLAMSKVLREELKMLGIRVTAILPGATLTDSWAGVDLPPERFIAPEDIAQSVLSAYELSKHSVVEELLIRPQLGDIN
jgi:short-subunit dehydrogenase